MEALHMWKYVWEETNIFFLRRQPRTIPDDLEALAEQDEGTDDKWSASDELFIRQYLSELMAWFNFQWGME